MYVNKAAINATAQANGGSAFTTSSCWSSTEFDGVNAWRQNFYSGLQSNGIKGSNKKVRAVRAF